MRRFARAIAPENPRSVLIVLTLVLGLISVFVFIDIVSGRMIKSAVGNFDYSLFNLFANLRTATADELFIRVTMLGDDIVLYATALGAVAWLLVQRNWRAALATILAVGATKAIVLAFGATMGLREPVFSDSSSVMQNFRFPSGHAVMASVVFGCFVILASRSMARWTQALVAATCGIIVLSIAFSRLYLGVSWLSDVLAGLMLAAIIITLYGVIIETLPARRIRPFGLIASGLVAFMIAGFLHVSSAYDRNEARYAARDRTITLPISDWLATGWTAAQMRRLDLAGNPEEVFVVQWLGPLQPLQTALENAGYKALPKWTWKDSFLYLDPHASLDRLAPKPALHEGLKAKFTAVESQHQNPNARLVVRVFASNFQVSGSTVAPVYLVSLTQESLRPRFNLFSVPFGQVASPDQGLEFLSRLLATPGLEKMASETYGQQLVTILKPSP